MKAYAIIGGLGMTLMACGGGGGDDGPRALTTPEAYQDFLWSYCLPFAEVLTDLANNESTSQAAGDPIACPGGGTAKYEADKGLATLTDCGGAGATVSGTIYLSNLQSGEAGVSAGQAMITAGSLTIAGAYEGTATINSGSMSWELPVADATTYWELRLTLDGNEECLWSGAETGPCPTQF
jgi:hypothetical protein